MLRKHKTLQDLQTTTAHKMTRIALFTIGALIFTYLLLLLAITANSVILDNSHDTTELSELLDKKEGRLEKLIFQDRHKRIETTEKHKYSLSEQSDTYSDCSYHLAFTLVEQASQSNLVTSKLLNKFSNTLESILLRLNSTNLDSGSMCIHLITDDSMRTLLNEAIRRVHTDLALASLKFDSNIHHQDSIQNYEAHRPLTRYFFIDSSIIETELDYILPTLKTYFTHKPNSYYSNALFFYSMLLHRAIPRNVADRMILLDVDVQLDANLLELYEQFGRFESDQVIGLANEQQPVYRHILYEYRRDNENTRAGSSLISNGFPGYNSGVVLLHLRKMRESKLYNSLLNIEVVKHLSRKYKFRGHLGDQDFYTLAALDYPQLFNTLPCSWNRQLCQWWKFHGYAAVFDDYHRCDEQVKLYHGNCNSALPTLTSYGQYRKRR